MAKEVIRKIRKVIQALAQRGYPGTVVRFQGGIGDHLLCSTVIHELKLRNRGPVWMCTPYPELFLNNPDVGACLADDPDFMFLGRFPGVTVTYPHYTKFLPEENRDIPPAAHILAIMCRQAGINGAIKLRPWFHLTDEEKAKGRLAPRQIAIQSSILSARYPMVTKEWFPDRFAEVSEHFKSEFQFVQIGSASDPLLPSVIDRRGQTSIRQTAAILANSTVFVGLVGFLMHLSRAVETPALIIYGGREHPDQSGYDGNLNLYSPMPCSPCWRYNDCPGQRGCMEKITGGAAINALAELLNNKPATMPSATFHLE